MEKILLFCLIILISCLVAGCKNNDGASLPQPDGTIFGSVTLYNRDATIDKQSGGVIVKIEGINDSAITDANGAWALSCTRNGIYSVVLSKPNYGYNKSESINFIVGRDCYVSGVSLVQLPVYSIVNISAVRIDSQTTYLVGKTSDTVKGNIPRPLLLYLGKAPPLFSDGSTYVFNQLVYQTAGLDSFYCLFPDSNIIPLGFASHDSVYIAVYPISWRLEGYHDMKTDKELYTSGIGQVPALTSYKIP